jgi:hypothetical protein
MVEHPTITIKKATECYVVGGIAFVPNENKHIFWYGLRRFPIMSKKTRQETGTSSMTEYIQKKRPEWKPEELEPSEEYVEFYKKIPEVFEEGSPERIKRTPPVVAPSQVIIEPTRVDWLEEATGEIDIDVREVVAIIKKVRELIWAFPVEGAFTSSSGLQGSALQQFINSNLKRAHKNVRLQRFAMNFRILPEATRYIDVATGTIFKTEEAVREAIVEYHTEPELMLAASKGGTEMTKVGELLKIADQLDEKGDFESADEITEIIKMIAAAQRLVKASKCPTCGHEDCECGCDSATGKGCQCKKAWIGGIVKTLMKVADSLESKGAFKEAQMADDLLQGLKEVPQGFISKEVPTATIEVAEEPVESAPVVEKLVEAPKTDAPKAEIEAPKVEDLNGEAPKAEAPKVETPFSNLPEEKKIEEPKDKKEFDEVSIAEFKDMIKNMKWRHTQGAQRQKYEEVLKRVEKAQEYFKAYKEWTGYAHELFGDEPIRIKIE